MILKVFSVSVVTLAAFAVALAELFVPDTAGFFFAETFQDSPLKNGRFVVPTADKYEGQPISIESCPLPTLEEDLGLMLKEANKFYGGGIKFDKPLKVGAGQDLVLQYEVQLTEGLTCGGAYLKVLHEGEGAGEGGGLDLAELTNETPYVIMFGPDKCGNTNKVHFILRHQNPVSGEWEEKHFLKAPAMKADKGPHLYTLHVTKDNGVEIFVDGESVASGSLLEHMDPPVNPSETIDDPSDSKPEDWVDAAKIPDPEARKPDDWDEDAPRKIPDMDAEMPSGWLPDEPELVDDPAAQRPADWDDDEDGEWEAPVISNPKCEAAPGCGVWTRPEKPNPDYKGKWKAPMIDNPAYKGEWAPRQIPNPHYFQDPHPHRMAAMGAVAVEIWTTSGGILMDNMVVTDDIKAALAFADKTWLPKSIIQKEQDEKEKKSKKDKARNQKLEGGGFMTKVQVLVGDALELAAGNPLPAAVGLLVLVLSAVLFCCGGGGAKKPAAPSQEEEEESVGDEPAVERKEEDHEPSSGEREPVTETVDEDDEEEEEEPKSDRVLRRRTRRAD